MASDPEPELAACGPAADAPLPATLPPPPIATRARLQDMPDIVLEQILSLVDGAGLRAIILTGNPRLIHFATSQYNRVASSVLHTWCRWYKPSIEQMRLDAGRRVPRDRDNHCTRAVRMFAWRLHHQTGKLADANLYLLFAPLAHVFVPPIDNCTAYLWMLETLRLLPCRRSMLDDCLNSVIALLGYLMAVAYPPPPLFPNILAAGRPLGPQPNGGDWSLVQQTNNIATPSAVAMIDEWMRENKKCDLPVTRWMRDMYVRTCLLVSKMNNCQQLHVRHIGDRRLFADMLPRLPELRKLCVTHLGESDLHMLVGYLQRKDCKVNSVMMNACMLDYVAHWELIDEAIRMPVPEEQVVTSLRQFPFDKRVDRKMVRLRISNYHHLTNGMLMEFRRCFKHWPEFEFENNRLLTDDGLSVALLDFEAEVRAEEEREADEPLIEVVSTDLSESEVVRIIAKTAYDTCVIPVCKFWLRKFLLIQSAVMIVCMMYLTYRKYDEQ